MKEWHYYSLFNFKILLIGPLLHNAGSCRLQHLPPLACRCGIAILRCRIGQEIQRIQVLLHDGKVHTILLFAAQ